MTEEPEMDNTAEAVRDGAPAPPRRLASPTARREGGASDPVATHPPVRPEVTAVPNPLIRIRDLVLKYGDTAALKQVSMDVPRNQVTALIGPSGCGKSTLLRCLNRMNDLIDNVTISGGITIGEQDILRPTVDVTELRKRIGMVFQKSNPFPKSIYENVAYGPRIHGNNRKASLDAIVEKSLRNAGLWEEVKDRLDDSALALSGGQQQRLCIARAVAVDPEVLLMDEPCSALDPASTLRIEELMFELKKDYTIVIVTHNMQQAGRISDFTGFLLNGALIEYDQTERMFTKPALKQTEDYITGRFG